MTLTLDDLETMPDVPKGIYTIDTGQQLIVWYDVTGKRHVSGMGILRDPYAPYMDYDPDAD